MPVKLPTPPANMMIGPMVTVISPKRLNTGHLRQNFAADPDPHLFVQSMKTIEENDRKITRQEAIIAHKEEVIAHKEEVIAHKDEVIAHKEEVIAKKEEVIAKKEEVIAKKEEVIAKKEEVIANQEEVIAKKEEVIANKEEVIAKKEEVIANKDEVIADQEEVIELLARRNVNRESVSVCNVKAPDEDINITGGLDEASLTSSSSEPADKDLTEDDGTIQACTPTDTETNKFKLITSGNASLKCLGYNMGYISTNNGPQKNQ